MTESKDYVRVNGPAGFFRVFDVAFFLPGLVLVGATHVAIPSAFSAFFGVRVSGQDWSTVEAWFGRMFAGFLLVASIFLLGLLCHAVHRLVWAVFSHIVEYTSGGSTQHACETVSGEAPTATRRLSLYFWNLASLTWNLEVALLAGGGLVLCGWYPTKAWPIVSGLLAAGLFPVVFTARCGGANTASRTLSCERGILSILSALLAIWLIRAELLLVPGGSATAQFGFLSVALFLLGFQGWEFRRAYWKRNR